MGIQNLKLEVETFQFQQPPNFGPLGITPVKTEADPVILSQIASQVSQLTLAVGQIHQAVVGQSFTRAAHQEGGEGVGLAEEVRKLGQRVEELEARAGKG